MSRRRTSATLFASGYWLVIYLLFWWLLSGNSGWGFGLLCALAASVLSVWLGIAPPHLKPLYLIHFLIFFLYEIFAGAWDVAKRAMHPRLPLNPAWVAYPLNSTNPQVHLLLSAMVGLMPGTLSTHFDEQNLYLHILDQDQDWQLPVAQTEKHLARLLEASQA